MGKKEGEGRGCGTVNLAYAVGNQTPKKWHDTVTVHHCSPCRRETGPWSSNTADEHPSTRLRCPSSIWTAKGRVTNWVTNHQFRRYSPNANQTNPHQHILGAATPRSPASPSQPPTCAPSLLRNLPTPPRTERCPGAVLVHILGNDREHEPVEKGVDARRPCHPHDSVGQIKVGQLAVGSVETDSDRIKVVCRRRGGEEGRIKEQGGATTSG